MEGAVAVHESHSGWTPVLILLKGLLVPGEFGRPVEGVEEGQALVLIEVRVIIHREIVLLNPDFHSR